MILIKEKQKRKGIVYILTNPCMPNWVKIGNSNKNDIKERLKSLNRLTIVPLRFQTYAIYHVSNPADIEKRVHALIDSIAPDCRAIEKLKSGKTRKREFFLLKPKQAYEIFKAIAGDDAKHYLELSKPSNEEIELKKEISQRKTKLSLKSIGIPNQAKIVFVKDNKITCIADTSNNKLIYKNKSFSITGLAKKLLKEKCGWNISSISGNTYFSYKGKTLEEIRRQKES